MENKKIDVLFGLVVIAFLVVTILLIENYKSQSASDLNDYKSSLGTIVKLKNNKIRILYNQLVLKQKENQYLKDTLAETRNDLDNLSKKLAPVGIPVSAAAK